MAPGRGSHQWQADEVERLRAAVSGAGYWESEESGAVSPCPLQLDDQHLSEADEAWIPVRTPDGPD